VTNVWAIAAITFLDGFRNRIYFALVVIALLLFSSTYSLSYLFPYDVVKVAIDLALAVTSLVGLILSLFFGAQLVAKDIERRTIHMLLTKAVSRSEYIVGKFAGLVAMIVTTMTMLGALASLAVGSVTWVTSDRYGVVDWPLFLLSLSMMTLMFLVLASVMVLVSAFASNSFLALGLTLVVYLIGQSVEELKYFLESGADGVTVAPIVLMTVKFAYYMFPNLAAFDFKTQAAHALAIQPITVVWPIVSGLIYMAVMLMAASWIFRSREFP